MGRLTVVAVKAAAPGRHHDGDGLNLTVKPNGSKFWVLRVMKHAKRSELGLGGFPSVSLADARAKAAKLRSDVKAGADPLADKRVAKAKRLEAGARTFAKVAALAHAQRSFRTPQLKARWIGRLERFAFPYLGEVPVDKIDGPLIIEALDPIWSPKPETARRVRQLVASVLKYAHARQWRGPVPVLADLTKEAFPAHDAAPKHHPAVEYPDAPAVLSKLHGAPQTAGRLALLFTVYTAARSGETRGATWGEVNFDKAEWTIPAARMKMKRDHVVPLSDPAVAILKAAAKFRRSGASNELCFPGQRPGRPLSDMTMAKAHKLVSPATVPHGWRSTFRDWAGEETAYSSDVCEAALAHLIGNATTRSYQRGTMLDKRRALMNDWATYLFPSHADAVELVSETTTVVPFARQAASVAD